MENDRYQKELFDFDDKTHKPFPRLEKMLPKADFEGRVSVTLGIERLVFIVIGFILLLVVVFAVGVERGKSMESKAIVKALARSLEGPAEPALPAAEPARPSGAIPAGARTAMQSQGMPARTAAAGAPSPAARDAAPAVKIDPFDDLGARPYTIVAASFKGRDAANAAADGLKKEGLAAYVNQNGPYFVVCVGGYQSRTAAQSTFTKVRRAFKDAYIKLR